MDVMQVLINANADLNVATFDHGTSPLSIAAEIGHLPVVEALLAARVDVHTVTAEDRSPLHLAANRGHAAIVRLLLRSDADPAAEGVHGTPLQEAMDTGHLETASILKDAIANADLKAEIARLRAAAGSATNG